MQFWKLTALGLLACATACGEDNKKPDNNEPTEPCSLDVVMQSDGGETDHRETLVELRVSGCPIDGVFLRKSGQELYLPATPAGGKSYRRWVDLVAGDNSFDVVVASGGKDIVANSLTFHYTAGAPQTTEFSGFIAGRVLQGMSSTPIAGALVFVRSVAGELETSDDGTFNFPTPGPGEFLVTVQAEGHTLAQRRVAVTTGHTYSIGDVRLVAHDSVRARITPAEGGKLINSVGDIELDVPAGAVRHAAEISAVSFPAAETLPNNLPDSSRWTQAIDLVPDGVRFDKPATVRLANELGFAPGTPIPIGYFNRDTGAWEPSAMGVVSDDGAWVVAELQHFSPYDFNLPAMGGGRPGGGRSRNDPCRNGRRGASLIDEQTGDLALFVPVATRMRNNRAEDIRLVYQSDKASHTIPYLLPVRSPAVEDAARVEAHLTLAGRTLELGVDVGEDLAPLYVAGARLDPTDATGAPLEPGIYPLQTRVIVRAPSTYMTAERFGGPGVDDTGVQTREPIPFDSPQTVPILVEPTDAGLARGWQFEAVERIFYDEGMQLAFLQRDRRNTVIHMGLADSLLAGADDVAAVADLQDFHFLADGRVVLVKRNALWIAPSLDELSSAEQVAALERRILDSALGPDGLVVINDELMLQRISLDGVVEPLEVQSAVAEALELMPEMVTPSIGGALAVDRDGIIYLGILMFGVVAIDARSDSVGAEIVPLGARGTAGSLRLVYSAPEHALYYTTSVDTTVWRYDLYAQNQSAYGTLTLNGLASFAGTSLARAPDGSLYYFGFGSFGRLTPTRMLSRFDSRAYSDLGPHDCWISSVRFAADGSPVAYCGSDRSNDGYLFALSFDKGRNHHSGELLTRTEDGFVLERPQERRVFDAAGRITERQVEGATEQFFYNAAGRLDLYVDAYGNQIGMQYTGGRLSGIGMPNGDFVSVTVDDNGDLVEIVDRDGRSNTFIYANHRMQSRSIDGVAISYTWSGGGVSGATLPTGEQRGYRSVLQALASSGVAPSDVAAARFTDGEGVVVTREYDAFGELASCDVAGQVWTMTAAEIARGRPGDPTYRTILSRENEQAVAFWTDGLPLTSVIDGYPVFQADFDSQGRRREIGGGGHLCSFSWSGEQLGSVTCDERYYVQYVYDGFGNLVALEDWNGNQWPVVFDALGNLVQLTDPPGGVTTLVRDEYGFVTSVTDSENKTWALTRDAVGDITSLTNPNGETTSFAYVAVPTCDNCAQGATTRLATIANALGHTWSFDIRADGHVASITNPLGEVRTFAYDNRRLLVGSTGPGGSGVSHTYDDLRRRTSMTVGDTVYLYEYDLYDRWTAAAGPVVTLARNYDDGTTETVTHSDSGVSMSVNSTTAIGTTIGFSTSLGQEYTVAAIAASDNAMAMRGTGDFAVNDDYSKGTAGRLQRRRVFAPGFALAVEVTRTYDDLQRLSTISVSAGAGGALADTWTFSYVGNTHRISATHAATKAIFPTLSFARDDAGRVLNVGLDASEMWAYDAGGRVSYTNSAGTFTYDDAGRLLSTNLHSYTYDAHGNRASRTETATGETWRYDLDAADRLVGASRYESASATTPLETLALRYDAFSRLSRVDVDSQPTYLLWLGNRLVGEADAAGQPLRTYLPGFAGDEVILMEQDGTEYYVISDHLGTVHRIIDAAGNIVASYSYDAYGRVLSEIGSLAAQPRRFAGAYYLAELGFYYLRERWYDPATAQFISPDPQVYVSDVPHPYAYAKGDPTHYVDFSGRGAMGEMGAAAEFGMGQVSGNAVGELTGGASTVYNFVTELDGYNSDPQHNARYGMQNLLKHTMLDQYEPMRKAADDFLNFSTNGLQMFNEARKRENPCD